MGQGWRKVFGSNLHLHGRNKACDEHDQRENAKGFHGFLLWKTLPLLRLQHLRKRIAHALHRAMSSAPVPCGQNTSTPMLLERLSHCDGSGVTSHVLIRM